MILSDLITNASGGNRTPIERTGIFSAIHYTTDASQQVKL